MIAIKRGARISAGDTLIRKRTASEWTKGDNLTILRGMAMQSSNIMELSRRMGESAAALMAWRAEFPLIREATEMGRQDSDAWVLADTFRAVQAGSQQAATRWWRFRIAGGARAASGNAPERIPTVIIDPARAERSAVPSERS